MVHMDNDAIKVLHRQFIDLSLGLAKVGIITEFQENNCGFLFEEGKYLVKYYVEPEQITITEDLEVVEEAVMKFCAEAMKYMQSFSTHSEMTLAGSMSESCLSNSIDGKSKNSLISEPSLNRKSVKNTTKRSSKPTK